MADFEQIAKVRAGTTEELEPRISVPHMEMNAVADRDAGLRIFLRRCVVVELVHELCPFEKVTMARSLAAVRFVGDEVSEGRQRPRNVEATPHVGHRIKEPSAGRYFAQMVAQSAERVLAMLQHVVGDEEADGRIAEFVETLAVVDDVDPHEAFCIELGVLTMQLGEGAEIDVANDCARRYRR